MKETKTDKKSFLNNSVLFFIFLTLLIIVISGIGSLFDLQATYTRINPVTGGLERHVIAIENMVSGDGLRYIIGNAITNFISFAPLGMVIISLIGIGIAYKSGLLPVLFYSAGKKMTKFKMTFIVVLLGILSSFGGDIGYVMLIPLAALFFLVNNRNPLAGIFASFVSVAAGYGVNLFSTNLDYSLRPFTQMAGALIDENFKMGAYNNVFFCIVATAVLAFFITYLTEKIIIPKMAKYKHDEELIIDEIVVNKKEKRGLVLAGMGSLLLGIIFIYMVIPGLPFSGVLLDKTETSYLGKLYGSTSYFNQGLVYMLSLILVFSGWLYGIGAKTIKNSDHLSKMFYHSLNNVGPLLVLFFFAAQFIAILRRTNLGTIVTVWLVDIVETLNFTSVPLIILFFLLIGLVNFLLPSPVTKWTILSPTIVPLFMKSNITPEFTQAVYRIGDSATNIIAPSLVYFVVLVGFIELYTRGDKPMSLMKNYRLLWIYSIGITALWLFIIVTWYIIGLPIGINVFPTV